MYYEWLSMVYSVTVEASQLIQLLSLLRKKLQWAPVESISVMFNNKCGLAFVLWLVFVWLSLNQYLLG